MTRKTMPMILMLSAGAITCIITFIGEYSVLEKLVALFFSMLIFFILGSILKGVLNYFDAQNEKKVTEEGEVIEKKPESDDEIKKADTAEK